MTRSQCWQRSSVVELVQVNKLYMDRPSNECVVVLEGRHTRKETRLVLPERDAAVLALEAHGVNDRCRLYQLLTSCVAALGGAFCNVVIRMDEGREAVAYLTLVHAGQHRALSVNAGESLALALHGGLPIYLGQSWDGAPSEEETGETDIPDVFKSLLSEIAEADTTDGV